MKRAFLLGCLSLLTLPWLQAQLLDVKLGTSESQLLEMAKSRTRQASATPEFSLINQTASSYTYRHVEEGYQLDITFTIAEAEVSMIKAVHSGLNTDHQQTMRAYYEETVKDWHNKRYFSPNPKLAAQAMQNFQGYQPEAAAFTDPNMSLMFVFMFYKKDGVAVFTRVERKF